MVAKVVVETNVFLAARDPGEPGHAAALALLGAADEGRILALVSVVTLAELRAGFTAAQLPALWTPFLSHLRASGNFSIEPVDEGIALTAGELRSSAGVSLPDALILATCRERGADCVATNDRQLLRAHSPVAARTPFEIVQ
ncbi:MAG: PIN domain-containing protein [Thermoplasmata archaeon]|nr:PIN domain-containing protein [Thermoplasmata archaeon]